MHLKWKGLYHAPFLKPTLAWVVEVVGHALRFFALTPMAGVQMLPQGMVVLINASPVQSPWFALPFQLINC